MANTTTEPIYSKISALIERTPHVMTAAELAPILFFAALAVAFSFFAAWESASEGMRRALKRKGLCFDCLVGDNCSITNKKVRDAADAWHPQ